MMYVKDIKIRDLVTLEDGKEYACFGTVNDNEDRYICLVTNAPNKKKEFLFAKQVLVDNYASLEIIEDEKTLNKIKTLLSKKYNNNTLN